MQPSLISVSKGNNPRKVRCAAACPLDLLLRRMSYNCNSALRMKFVPRFLRERGVRVCGEQTAEGPGALE